MINLQLRIGAQSHSFTGPSTWAELSADQAVAVMRYRQRVNQQHEVIFPLLQRLYGLRQRHLQYLFDERFLRRKSLTEGERSTALQLGEALIDTLDWILTSQPGPGWLVSQLRPFAYRYGTPSVLWERLMNRDLYYAPAPALTSSTFEEFMYAEKAYQGKNYALLAAILYRPGPKKAPEGTNRRNALDKNALEARAAKLDGLEPALTGLIVAQYEACQRELQRCFPRVFPKKLDFGAENEPKSTQSGGNWLDVAINLAGLDVTKIARIEQTNLYLALKVLDEQIRQADELDKKLEKSRKK